MCSTQKITVNFSFIVRNIILVWFISFIYSILWHFSYAGENTSWKVKNFHGFIFISLSLSLCSNKTKLESFSSVLFSHLPGNCVLWHERKVISCTRWSMVNAGCHNIFVIPLVLIFHIQNLINFSFTPHARSHFNTEAAIHKPLTQKRKWEW